jgi:hypothetical protein
VTDRNEPEVECKCPKCQRLHLIRMVWTGRGTPRVYCRLCLEQVGKCSTVFSITRAPRRNGLRSE